MLGLLWRLQLHFFSSPRLFIRLQFSKSYNLATPILLIVGNKFPCMIVWTGYIAGAFRVREKVDFAIALETYQPM